MNNEKHLKVELSAMSTYNRPADSAAALANVLYESYTTYKISLIAPQPVSNLNLGWQPWEVSSTVQGFRPQHR